MLGNILFISILTVSILRDLTNKDTKHCIKKNRKMYGITILHHLFSVFIHFGWMLSPISLVYIYLISALSMLIYWFIYGFCHVTKYVNKTCEWDKDKYFNDLTYDLKVSNKVSAYMLYLIGIAIALYRVIILNS